MIDPADNDDYMSPPAPRVTGSPDSIWLVYGELEHDDTHEVCDRDGDVSWCEDQQFVSDVRYVRADLAAQPVQADAPTWECKAGGLKPLTQAQYEKQPATIRRHYTRAAPQADALDAAQVRRAAERTREDLGATGTNYPDVRVLLAFAEQALGITGGASLATQEQSK